MTSRDYGSDDVATKPGTCDPADAEQNPDRLVEQARPRPLVCAPVAWFG